MTKVAVLDDWQRIADASGDWSALKARAEVVFFHEAFASEDEAAQKLADFDIVMALRERTAFPPSLVARLPKLKLFGMTGKRGATIDLAGMAARGITLTYTSGSETGVGTAELALGLMMAAARSIARGDAAIRAGGFQDGVPAGPELAGKTLGLVGLGRIGRHMARYGKALGMNVLAWSPNLDEARATEGGAHYRTKDELLAQADVVSLHIVLSDRTRGVIGARELGLMKSGAILVNTSRGPLVDEAALIAALEAGTLIAALDVYDREPLPPEHPLRRLANTVLTPHLGYGTRETFAEFYGQGIENVLAFLDGKPIRLLHPDT
ncbi:D-2-hydroxyacid dehydrogenase family protein [Bosea sp. 124]|uniref:D-2-hydroxyacid dehydrogenase family protein n=1 Tax=Bosea sp. 124 TaxID=2135642 RepID=UPI000D33577F|nr:D-2-hydroxyacid dehydrogenase family protein [Bosea sp. 124]PTM43443.1 phosphoglycerate dehydrogenase-like enzyme [Bosea sp. 124]